MPLAGKNNAANILDYKPEAEKEKKAVKQLIIYALALASRTKLPLSCFKCAWFDEKNYYEFFPLHCVLDKHGKNSLTATNTP